MKIKTFFSMFVIVVVEQLTQPISGASVDLQDSSKNGGSSLNPASMKLSMTMNGGNMDLNLTKSSTSDSTCMTLVVLRKNGVNTPWNEQRTGDFALYQDPNRLASILSVPQRSSDGSIERTVQGTFKYNNDYYYLKKDPSKRKKRSGADQYIATKIPPPDLKYAAQSLPNVTMLYAGELLNYAPTDKANYIVELLMVIDYSIYKLWYDLSPKKTEQDKMTDAINGIRYFYAQVVNGVDLRYYSIAESDFSIRVRLVGYYIAMTAQDSVWTESNDIRKVIDGTVYSDAYKALDSMATWTTANAKDLPTFDQASLITNNVLMAGYYDNNINSPRSISGLANIQGICGVGRVSVNKEGGEYSDCETIAHELGHNLGALHDGDQNTCPGAKQYIMSSAPSQLTPDTFLNPYRFSSCSVNFFRSFLGALRTMNTNCLLTTNANFDPNSIDQSSKVPPGQFINADQQCQHLYGVGSYYCGGNINDKTICSSMWCYDPGNSRCVNRVELRAANGTTCGNRKWCVMGTCQPSSSAPVASDFCLSGDYRGDVVDCKTQISQNSGLCYQSYYNETCCASCQAVRDRNTDSCPYGDNNPSYCQSNIIAQYCYDPNIQKQCCATCKKFETNIPNCLYGDSVNWCASSDNSVCYKSQQTCCGTCYYRYTGYKDCPYGDQVLWCQGLPKAQCADSSTAATCCIACDPKKTSVTVRPRPTTVTPPGGGGGPQPPSDPNCRDTASYCSTMPKSYCYSTQKLCCQTCNSYNTRKAGCEYGSRFSWCKTVSSSDCKYLEYKGDCCEQCGTALDFSVSNFTSLDDDFNVTDVALNVTQFQQRSVASQPLPSLTTWSYVLLVFTTVTMVFHVMTKH